MTVVDVAKLNVLSIRQPWADLIVRGLKTIEVRPWQVNHRGPFLIHVSNTIDWKSANALGYEDGVESLPRKRLVAYAEIIDVFPFTRERWLETLKEHWVVHPLAEPSFGAVLTNVRPFRHAIQCGGNLNFFTVPAAKRDAVSHELRAAGIEVTSPAVAAD